MAWTALGAAQAVQPKDDETWQLVDSRLDAQPVADEAYQGLQVVEFLTLHNSITAVREDPEF